MELIEIKKEVIGAEDVNSVNARDIHKYLEVKTTFSNWIKRAIEKYDFLENVDFVKNITVAKNGKCLNQGLPQQKIDYIVSMDMAKELSMLENNAKGRETRKYFISVEKKALAPAIADLTPVLKMVENQTALVLQQNEMILQQQVQLNRINDKLDSRSRQDRAIDKQIENMGYQLIKTVDSIANVLKPQELDHIRNSIQQRAEELAMTNGETVAMMTRTIYSYINGKFDVSSYYHIKSRDFLAAIKIIEDLRIS